MRIPDDGSHHMADDEGGWHSLFNKNAGNLCVGLCVFEEPLKYKETPVN
jgi:hypothetical protein